MFKCKASHGYGKFKKNFLKEAPDKTLTKPNEQWKQSKNKRNTTKHGSQVI